MNATIIRGKTNQGYAWGVLPEGSEHPVYVARYIAQIKNFIRTYGYEVTNWKNVREIIAKEGDPSNEYGGDYTHAKF